MQRLHRLLERLLCDYFAISYKVAVFGVVFYVFRDAESNEPTFRVIRQDPPTAPVGVADVFTDLIQETVFGVVFYVFRHADSNGTTFNTLFIVLPEFDNYLPINVAKIRPRLPVAETEVLKAELKKHLVTLNVPRPRKPWKEIRKVSKEKRKVLVQQFRDQLPPDVLKAMEVARQMRSLLFLGVNAVSCGIESDSVACCFLAEDVSPLSIVKHVVQLASHAKVPVFLVEGFKQFCLEVMGFNCIALGIVKPTAPISEPNVFSDVCSLVQEFYQKWEKTRKTLSKAVHPDVVDEEEAPPGKHHTTTQTSTTTADAQESCDFLSSASSYHLTRQSKYERAFTPVVRSGLQCEEVVCLKKYTDESDAIPPSKTRTKYKLPNVLRVRNNPFKLKRKRKKKKKGQ